MVFQRDLEIIELKRMACADYRDIGNELGISPNLAAQRANGFARWLPGEREKALAFLQERISEQRATAEASA